VKESYRGFEIVVEETEAKHLVLVKTMRGKTEIESFVALKKKVKAGIKQAKDSIDYFI